MVSAGSMKGKDKQSRRNFMRLVGGSGIVASSTLLAGCSSDQEPTEQPGQQDTDTEEPSSDDSTEEPSGDERRGGTLVSSLQADPDTLHPQLSHEHAGAQVSIMTTNSLVRWSTDLEIVPDLAAEMPEVSDDGTQLVFTLREGVTFHEPYDRELVAEDVVTNIRQCMDPEYGNHHQGELVAQLVDDPEEAVQATGEYEVTFTQSDSWAPEVLLTPLAEPRLAILPPEALEEHGEDFGTVSTGVWGTGPFKYVEGTQGSNYVFERNPNYFKDELPYLDGVRYEIIREASTRTSALLTGDVDYVDVLSWQDVERVKDNENVATESTFGITPGGHYTNNGGCDLVGNKTVRQALRYATNKEAIVNVQFYGEAEPMWSPFPPVHQFYDEDAVTKYPYDPEQARSLLEEAGETDLSLSARVTNQPFYMDGAEIVQQTMSDAGIELEIIPTDKSSTWTPALEGREEPVSCDEWTSHIEDFGPGPSASGYIGRPYQTDNTLNVFHYSNDDVDQWLEDAMLTTDEDERQQLYNNAAGQITEDAVYNYLTWPNIMQARNTKVQNMEVSPKEDLVFESVWLDE